ncbi:hypothetical protein AKJ38_03875 [candidate division MSBL1 archaeon SCGC-AAA259I14]|uniref:Uncharacterized protein n=1 Tax=candidate division MSBL1 archaeon SCGC-AAA259I14 TaxID=1698268 RepID=A0A133UPH8_9EURY|nr:hypothetical protein AKJ38_03875 [candidate division MSBL1 archaeon SCGC-AAA259I14]
MVDIRSKFKLGGKDMDKVKLRWSDRIPKSQCKEIPHGKAGEIRTEDGGMKEVCILAFDKENEPVDFDWDELGGEGIKIKEE